MPSPVHVGADLVTIWHQVDPGGRDPTATDLGAVLRAIHALDQHPPDLPTWSITAGIRARLAVSPDLDADDRAFLRAELTAVEHGLAALSGIAPLVPPGIIHGDAHVLIVSPAGPVLCDYDSTSIGPREWDLTPAAPKDIAGLSLPTGRTSPVGPDSRHCGGCMNCSS